MRSNDFCRKKINIFLIFYCFICPCPPLVGRERRGLARYRPLGVTGQLPSIWASRHLARNASERASLCQN